MGSDFILHSFQENHVEMQVSCSSTFKMYSDYLCTWHNGREFLERFTLLFLWSQKNIPLSITLILLHCLSLHSILNLHSITCFFGHLWPQTRLHYHHQITLLFTLQISNIEKLISVFNKIEPKTGKFLNNKRQLQKARLVYKI